MNVNGLNNRDNYFVAFIFVTIFCFVAFFCLLICMNSQFASMEYIWNYALPAKIYSGLLPYRDFNMLLTPLSFYITALFFNLLGNAYLTYAVTGSLIISFKFYLIYRVFLLIYSNKKIAINILLLTIFYNIFSLTVYNYNNLSLVIILAIILLEFNNRVSILNNIIIGILLALLFLTKQNIFFVVVLMSGINILVCTSTIRVKLTILGIRALMSFSVICAYLIYLYSNNALYNFIDYGFLGLLDFSEKNTLVDSNLLYLYCILPTIMLIKAIYLVIKQKRYALDDKLFMLLCYAVGGLSMIYPIFDLNHLTMGFILVFLLVPYIFVNSRLLMSSVFRTLFILFFISLLIAKTMAIKSEDFLFYSESNYYRHAIAHRQDIDNMREMVAYIKRNHDEGKNIVILDSRAMAYFSELGIYDNPYDMLVQGNLGYKGEQKTLAKIKELDDKTLFLIGDTNRIQEVVTIKRYAMCHYNFIGKVGNFFIYEKPLHIDENKDCNVNIVG